MRHPWAEVIEVWGATIPDQYDGLQWKGANLPWPRLLWSGSQSFWERRLVMVRGPETMHRLPPSVLSVMCSTHCSGGHCRGKGCPNLTGLTERWSTFKDRSDIPVKWPTWNTQHTGSLLSYSSFFVSIRGIHPPPEHGWDLCMWSLRLPWGSFNIRFAFLRHKCKGYKLQRRGQE